MLMNLKLVGEEKKLLGKQTVTRKKAERITRKRKYCEGYENIFPFYLLIRMCHLYAHFKLLFFSSPSFISVNFMMKMMNDFIKNLSNAQTVE